MEGEETPTSSTDPGADDTPSDADKQVVPDPTDKQSTASDQTASDDKPPADAADTAASTEDDAAPPADDADVPDAERIEELPDDVIEELGQAYKDKLLSSQAFKDEVAKRVKQQVDQQVTEAVRGREQDAEVEALIEQGKQAVNGITSLAEAAKRELEKAKRGEEEFSTEVLDPAALAAHLRNYGSAIVADVARTYDKAIEEGFLGILQEKLPPLTPEQAGDLEQIVTTARRMEGDPRQSKQAKAYFQRELLGFVFQRAHDAGRVFERDQSGKKSSLAKRITDGNAVKAAQAKLAAQRGDPPPKAPAGKPANDAAAPSGPYDSEYYRQLKRDGRHDDAQAYITQFAQRRGVPALT